MIFGVARRYIVRGQNQRDTRIFAVLCLFWLRDVSSARRVATCVYSDGFEYSKQMAQYHCWQRNKSKRKKKKAFNKVVRWIIDFVAPKDMRSRFCFFLSRSPYACVITVFGRYHLEGVSKFELEREGSINSNQS